MSRASSMSGQSSMMRSASEYLREIAAARQARDVTPSGKGAGLLGMTTTDGHYPAIAQSVYVVSPVELDADDTEGATATPSGDTDQNTYAVNLGTSIPPQGTLVICSYVGGALCFRFDG